MGAAMAPAAYATLTAHFQDTGREPDYYDLIVTGDLGKLGRELLLELFRQDGVDLSTNHNDCGLMIFDLENQDVHCGGSAAAAPPRCSPAICSTGCGRAAGKISFSAPPAPSTPPPPPFRESRCPVSATP